MLKMGKKLLNKTWASYTIAACSAVLFYLILANLPQIWISLGYINSLFSPVIIAIAIAYVLNPLNLWLNRQVFFWIRNDRLRKNISIFITVAGVALLIIVLVVALIPQVISSVAGLLANMDGYLARFRILLRDLTSFAAERDLDISGAIAATDDVMRMISTLLPSNLGTIISTSKDIGLTVFDWIISFILAIYFLADRERIMETVSRFFRAVMPLETYQKSSSFWYRINGILIRYVSFDLLDGLIVGVTNFIFMTFTNMPYSLLISVVVGVTNLAPTFGPMIGGFVGALILVLVNPWNALIFVIFTLVLQTIDGYVLKPKLFSGSLGVPSVWILITLIVGGRIFGVPGIMLSIPFAAIASFVFSDYITQREKEAAAAAQASSAKAPQVIPGKGEIKK